MNVVVLGNGRINSILERQLAQSGIVPHIFEDIKDISSVSGEKGSFLIRSGDVKLEAAGIIITEEPLSNCELSEGLKGPSKIIPLEDDAALNALPFSDIPVVFVLDYPFESPAYMTRIALERVTALARRKRKVVYLSKFMRTAGDALESLYKEARSLGVVFFKYDSISINYSEDKEAFHISVKDMYDGLEIFTHFPVLAGRAAYGDGFSKILKLLKLKPNGTGLINEDSFYLFPSLTNRKGIYFINMKTTSGSDSEIFSQVQYVISDIVEGIHQAGLTDSDGYAEVDPGKCAFCYTCYRACPHSAMTPDYDGSAMKNLKTGCFGCGICASVCPANAITMVRESGAKNMPSSDSLKILCCENSAEIAFGRIDTGLKENGYKVEIAPVSCGGELSAETIISALKDFDRVLVAVCMDKACRHFEGNKRALRSVERAKEMLRASGLDENRMAYIQLSHAMPAVLSEYIKQTVRI